MRKKTIFSLILVAAILVGVMVPMLVTEWSARKSSLPCQYQVELQGGHYRYLIELSDLSDEFQVYLQHTNEVNAYIQTFIDQMIYDGYEAECIAEIIICLLERYMYPLMEKYFPYYSSIRSSYEDPR